MKTRSLFFAASMSLICMLAVNCDKDGKQTGTKYPDFKAMISSENIIVEPQPLEAIGGQVPVTINMIFPPKFMYKTAVMTVVPVLKYSGGEGVGSSYNYQGESVDGDSPVILFADGGIVEIKPVFSYKPEMNKSELFLRFSITYKSKETSFEIKVADGVIST